MRFAYVTNTRGVAGHPVGVTSVKDLYYLASGDTEVAIREAAAAGYAGIELFDGNLLEYPGGIEALRALLDGLGIVLVAVYTGANLIFPEILPDELWRIERAAAAASRLSAEHLIVGGGAVRAGGTSEADYEQLGKSLNEIIEIADANGLAASFHPHLGTCVASREQIDKALAQSQIFLCPDTGHLAAAGVNNEDLIRTYGDRIKYVHLKDYVSDPLAFVPLGQGQLDLALILQALDDIGYDGWLAVEVDGYLGNPQEAAESSKHWLDAHLSRPL